MNGLLKNFTYLIICEKTGKTAIVDPGIAGPGAWWKFRKVLKFIKSHRFDLSYIINTHRHYDHVKGNGYFIRKTGAEVISYNSGLRENDIVQCGEIKLKVIETPGHTADGICLYSSKNLFTGDTLFVGDSGATVSSDSNRPQLGESLRKLIKLCPPDTVIWPGHDLGKTRTSTLAYEQEHNVNSEEYRLKEAVYKAD